MGNGRGFIHALPSDIRALCCDECQEGTASLGLRVESTELEFATFDSQPRQRPMSYSLVHFTCI